MAARLQRSAQTDELDRASATAITGARATTLLPGRGGSDEVRQAPSGDQEAELRLDPGSGQDLALLRRGEDQESEPYEILPLMGSQNSGSEPDEATSDSPSGISAFVARVLDQLSLSAWLPAAVLTAGVAVLLQFRSDKSADVLAAVRALTADPVRVLVLIIPLLVIATVVTQAFSFEAIRTLEGYWRRRGLIS